MYSHDPGRGLCLITFVNDYGHNGYLVSGWCSYKWRTLRVPGGGATIGATKRVGVTPLSTCIARTVVRQSVAESSIQIGGLYSLNSLTEQPASVATTPSVNVFKKRLEEVWTGVFPHLPHWLNTPTPSPPPFPPAHHPLTVIMSICNPTPCFIYVVSSGPLWPTFYHYKS